MTSEMHQQKPNLPLQVEVETTCRLAQLIDSPRALTVYLLCKNSEFGQLLELEIDASDYEDPSRFAEDYLITELMSKSPNLPVGIDRKAVAMQGFLESEQSCREVNDLFAGPEGRLPLVSFEMRRIIARILGTLVPDTVLHNCSFGPGATTSKKSLGLTPSDKYNGEIHLTRSLIPFVKQLMGARWHDSYRRPFTVVNGSRMSVVPKNAKTDRVICIEPDLNIWFQKGIGAVMRSRLRRSGIDLDDQTVNQSLARRACRDNLATIDLKAASDSVSRGLVEYLLPAEWLHIMELCRSPSVFIEGSWHELQKWSSMGNGYTFELESLIFWALCLAIVPHSDLHLCSVYGDDIIVPQKWAGLVVDALKSLGFNVNLKKSHLAGDFFESCGRHYFRGNDVTPFFMRGSRPNCPYEVHLANRLRVWSSQLTCGFSDAKYKPVWHYLHKRAPGDWRRLRVPEILGDVGFFGPRTEAVLTKPLKFGHEGLLTRTVRLSSRKRKDFSFGYNLWALHIVGSRGLSESHDVSLNNMVPLRGLYGRLTTGWTKVLTWSYELSWL